MLRFHVAAAAAMALIGSAAHGATFDFTSLGSNNTALAQSVTVGNVKAEAFKLSGGSLVSTNTTLWLRNQTNDHGLGICSEGSSNCSGGGGDVNEISSLTNTEVLKLTRDDGFVWKSLWLSSLDGNGDSDGPEDGTLYYSTTGVFDINSASRVQFSFGAFGANVVEGDLFTLAAFNIQALKEAKYLFFKPGSPTVNNGNNDFLVWKGVLDPTNPPNEVPEPSTYALMLAGLAMLGFIVRRRTQA